MTRITDQPRQPETAAQDHDTAVLAALELSTKKWLVALSISGSEKVSKHAIPAWGSGALLGLLSRAKAQAEKRAGAPVNIEIIQEAGRDGFSVHRMLEAAGLKSHVVDPASIAVDRRKRRAKTDRLDVLKLLQTLAAWRRGERLVCSMVRPPTVEQEDHRRLGRERERLKKERDQHVVRVKSLLALHGVSGFEPLRRDHASGWSASARRLAARCRPTPRPRSCANSSAWSSPSRSSRPSRRGATAPTQRRAAWPRRCSACAASAPRPRPY